MNELNEKMVTNEDKLKVFNGEKTCQVQLDLGCALNRNESISKTNFRPLELRVSAMMVADCKGQTKKDCKNYFEFANFNF